MCPQRKLVLVIIEEIFVSSMIFVNFISLSIAIIWSLSDDGKKRRYRATQLIDSEIITLLLHFQFSKYHDFKA